MKAKVLSVQHAKGGRLSARKQKGHRNGDPDARPLETASPQASEAPMTASKPTTAELHDLYPADTPAYMLDAWRDCIAWAIGEPKILAAFRADTGNNWTPATSPIERMIDASTNVERDFIKAFIKWHNVNIWGPIDGPPANAEAVR